MENNKWSISDTIYFNLTNQIQLKEKKIKGKTTERSSRFGDDSWFQLPVTSYQLPVINYQLPVTSYQ